MFTSIKQIFGKQEIVQIPRPLENLKFRGILGIVLKFHSKNWLPSLCLTTHKLTQLLRFVLKYIVMQSILT